MTAPDTATASAQLNDYGALLRRQWWVLALTLVLGLVAAAAYTASQPRVYTSTTQVLVTPTGVDDDSVSASARTRAEINLDTEAQLLSSTAVVLLAQEMLDSPLTLDQLADRLSVSVPPNTEVLTIGFKADTAVAAQQGADAFAVAYLSNRGQAASDQIAARQDARQSQVLALTTSLQEVTASLAALAVGSAQRAVADAQVQSLSAQIAVLTAETNELDSLAVTPGRTISDATLPRSPSSPVLPMNLAGGAMLGLLAGCGVAVLRQRTDHQLRDAVHVTRITGLPLLVSVGSTSPSGVADADTPEGRAYVRLRNILIARGAETQVVLVAGVQHEGSAVATNLAAALARTGTGVILVSTYPESGAARRLGLGRRGPSLCDLLERPTRSVHVGRRSVPGVDHLHAITTGRDPHRAAALLQTDRGRDFVDELRESGRFVIIDVPPTATSGQAQTLAGLADAAILVVAARSTTAEETIDAVAQFGAVGTPLLGGVLLPAPVGSRGSRLLGGRRSVPVDDPSSRVVQLAHEGDAPDGKEPAEPYHRGRPGGPGTRRAADSKTDTEHDDGTDDTRDVRSARGRRGNTSRASR